MNWLRISWMLYKINVRARMQYRVSFLLTTLLASVVTVAEFLGLAVVLHAFGAIRGWNVWEIGYLYGVLMTAKYLYRGFGSAVNNFEPYLVNGQLDQLLLRPMPLLLSVLTSRTRMVGGELLQSLSVLGVCLGKLLGGGDGRLGRDPFDAADRLHRDRHHVRRRPRDGGGRLLDDANRGPVRAHRQCVDDGVPAAA
ncbi:ABC-2 family transporter protein [Cohnella ginsengisoli]|uniref:ABC-2 family transporter protein n=1 Tax=Cohnella ginsengisoli TaxID=425004 RepID=A0A9X4QQA9_9BACL|nr:ABC-2 family transporter protein [Cohnella ginsengisoli]MDG0794763.1 ABC-2 family transporter protein [Cohnella ginsengisoli]